MEQDENHRQAKRSLLGQETIVQEGLVTNAPDSRDFHRGQPGEDAEPDFIMKTFILLTVLGAELTARADMAADFNYQKFDSSAGLILQGGSALVDGRLRLTPDSGGVSGGAWVGSKQVVKNGFVTTFQLQINKRQEVGADGLAFVIQNAPEPSIGYPGCNIGYGGLTNALAVKFNNYHFPDHAFGSDYGRYDLLAVMSMQSPTKPLWDQQTNTIAAVTNGVNFSDGQVHTAKLIYVPGNLEVFLDDMENPLMTVYVNLAKVMNLDEGRAWVGFTAATGGFSQEHEILSWSFASDDAVSRLRRSLSAVDSSSASTLPPTKLYQSAVPTDPALTPLPWDRAFGYGLPAGIEMTQNIEASTDMVHWAPATNVLFYFRDLDSTNFNERYYRFVPR